MFVISKLFQPSAMFVGKAGVHPIEEPFKCFTLGKAPSLAHKHRLGWKGLPRTNTLAYYKSS